MKKFSILTVLILFAVWACPVSVYASVEMLKVYREVNPDLKPNCMYCHVDKLPKKDLGKHEVNAYGAKIKKLLVAEKIEMTAEQKKEAYSNVFKQLGRHDVPDVGTETGK